MSTYLLMHILSSSSVSQECVWHDKNGRTMMHVYMPVCVSRILLSPYHHHHHPHTHTHTRTNGQYMHTYKENIKTVVKWPRPDIAEEPNYDI